MMIWDTFMFRNELDMAQCRFEEFEAYGVEVNHVLVESLQDFHGRDKPLFYAANEGRFNRWWDKIFHVVVPELPDAEDPWVREHAQRDAMCATIDKLAADDDLVLIADADEIPAQHLMTYGGPPAGLLMRTCHSAVDWLYPAPMPGSVIGLAKYIKGQKLSAVRDGRPAYRLLADGGWHLSWLGGPQAQNEKLTVSCHRELPDLERRILAGGHGYYHGEHHDVQMVAVDVDGTWPRYVRERRCPPNWFRPRPGSV
jgi:hypothetical protein